jgi:hypothetical protein
MDTKCSNAVHLHLIRTSKLDRCPSCNKPLFRVPNDWKCIHGTMRIACDVCNKKEKQISTAQP